MKYEDIRDQMKVGDIVAFSGHGPICSLIKLITGSPYSHVSLVYDIRKHGGLAPAVLLMESTAHMQLEDDGLHGKIVEGVQMHFLSKRINDYPGEVWWVPLKQPLTSEQIDKVQAFAIHAYDDCVPFNWNGLYGIGIELLTGLKLFTHSDFNAFFCSQFVTRALKETSIVPQWVEAASQTPRSVVESPCFTSPVRLR